MPTPIQLLKDSHRPNQKAFYDKPNEFSYPCNRVRTRPWDNCWFSNKPEIINLTVEEAIKQHPKYMLWCYANLNIKWSTHTIKLFDKIQPKSFKAYDNTLNSIMQELLDEVFN